MILAIPLNFEEALKELKELTKTYDTSLGIERYMLDGKLTAEDCYYEYRNQRWEIMVSRAGYLVMHPYQERCKIYVEEKRNLRK